MYVVVTKKSPLIINLLNAYEGNLYHKNIYK
jgi:hypothetical protein